MRSKCCRHNASLYLSWFSRAAALILCRTLTAQTCPIPPIITPTGSLGVTTWGYVVVSNASTPVTAQLATTNAGVSQLSATNYNLVDFSSSGLPTTGTYSIYRVYVGIGGSPAGIGLIGTMPSGTCSPVTVCQFQDTGQSADTTQQPPYYPSLASYQAGLQSLVASMNAQSAVISQPRILLSGQHQFAAVNVATAGFPSCVPDYGQAGSCGGVHQPPCGTCPVANATFLNAYTDALALAGAQAIDINIDPIPLLSSPEYASSPFGIADVNIIVPGTMCSAATTATFSPSGATGTVNLNGLGGVSGVTVTNAGIYSTGTTVTVSFSSHAQTSNFPHRRLHRGWRNSDVRGYAARGGRTVLPNALRVRPSCRARKYPGIAGKVAPNSKSS